MLRHYLGLALLTVVVLLAGLNQALSQGQLSTATLTGRITDASGGVIPGVQLSLQNEVGGAPRTTISNGEGYYSLEFLPPGTYDLRATKTGFSQVVVPGLKLGVHQTANVNITLQPGKLVQQVQVSAMTTALQTQTSSLSEHVSSQQVTQLPLAEQDSTLLVNLAPGVTLDNRNVNPSIYRGVSTQVGTAQFRMAFSMNGGNTGSATEVVDGVDVSFGREVFPESPTNITPDFMADMQVLTNNLPAEFGGGAGTVNIATKSGTNSIHGTAYEFLQNSAFNATDLFLNSEHQSAPHSNLNQFGFSLGGPIIRNKIWFFGDFGELRHIEDHIIETSVPTAAERTGDFSGLITSSGQPITVFNPSSTYTDPTTGRTLRQPFAGNVIPSSMFDPFGVNLMKYYPQPNNPGLIASNGQPTGINNLLEAPPFPLNDYQFDVKIDYDLGGKNRIMGRFSQNKFVVTPVNVFHNPANPAGLSQDYCTDLARNVAVSLTSTLSPTLVLTQSISVTRDHNFTINPSEGFNVSSLGGPYASGAIEAYGKIWDGGTAFPNVTVTNYAPMGEGRPLGGYNYTTSAYTYQAMVAKVKASHTFKAGFEGMLMQNGELYATGYSGSFSYTGMFSQGPNPLTPSVNTGNALADMLLGTLGGGDMSTGFTDFTSSKYVAGFIEDDWRVTPKLTLNLGFRYDFTTPFIERFNHLSWFDPFRPNPIGSNVGPNTNGESLNQYLMSLGGGPVQGVILFPNSPGANGREIVNTDFKSGIQPRLGFAYAITPNLVFRGGFSRLDFKSAGAAKITTNAQPGITAATPITATIDGIHPAVTTSNPFPSGFLTPTYDSQGLLTDLGEALATGETSDLTPYAWEWNAGFQYSLSKLGVLSVAYAGSRERQLTCPLGRCGDQVPEADLSKFGSALLSSVPNPFYGIITTPGLLLSQPNVQLGELLRMNPEYQSWTNIYPGTPYQGPNNHTFQGDWDALEVGLNAPTWHNLSMMLAYTVSKNITNADAVNGSYLSPTVGYQNIYNFQGERSLSAMDVPQRLVIGYVYQLPVGHGKRFASSAGPLVNKVIGGWTWGGIVTDASGFPLSISETGHTTGAFAGGDRPNLVGNPCLSSGRSRGDKILQYLNPAAFQTPPNFSFGDAPRLLDCRVDGEKNYDMNLSKTTQLTERFGLQLRADAFNLFNRPQLNAPNTTFNSASFGRITSQYNLPRVIQLGLKLVF